MATHDEVLFSESRRGRAHALDRTEHPAYRSATGSSVGINLPVSATALQAQARRAGRRSITN